MALQSPRKAAEAVSERTATQVETDIPVSAEATIEGQPSLTVATSAESAEDERDVEAAGGAALVLTNSPIAPASHGEAEASSLTAADQPQAGGDDVTAQAAAKTNQAGPLVKQSPATFTLRPNCLRPQSCAGHGDKHCHGCNVALREGAAA
jgi:hypothetical protein